MYKTRLAVPLLIIIIGAGILGLWWWQNSQPGKFDDFAKCLAEKQVKFYGAFWCSHCQNQKKLFGSSQKYLSYIECSTPDGKNQLEACNQAGIQAYPTWEFPDGAREQGELPLSALSEKSGCQLPQ